METDGEFEHVVLWDVAWDAMQCSAVYCAFLRVHAFAYYILNKLWFVCMLFCYSSLH